jgi:hypothetical protein
MDALAGSAAEGFQKASLDSSTLITFSESFGSKLFIPLTSQLTPAFNDTVDNGLLDCLFSSLSLLETIETFHRDKGDSENSGGFPEEKGRKREICFENSNNKSIESAQQISGQVSSQRLQKLPIC